MSEETEAAYRNKMIEIHSDLCFHMLISTAVAMIAESFELMEPIEENAAKNVAEKYGIELPDLSANREDFIREQREFLMQLLNDSDGADFHKWHDAYRNDREEFDRHAFWFCTAVSVRLREERRE